MNSRLRKVEHILVFDTYDEMGAGPAEEPYWYMYQKQVFLGKLKLRDVTYHNKPKKIGVSTGQLKSLKKAVSKMINGKSFKCEDVENQPEWVDINIPGGSSISYTGENRQKFLKKVLGVEDRVR